MPSVSYYTARRAARFSATILISLIPPAAHPHGSKDAYTVDLSSLGARIRTNFDLHAGERVEVGESGKVIPCRVVWAQPSYPFGSVAGLEFLNAPETDGSPAPSPEDA